MLSILLFQFISKPALLTWHRKGLHCLSFLFPLALVYFKSEKNCQGFLQYWKEDLTTKQALFQVHVSNKMQVFTLLKLSRSMDVNEKNCQLHQWV